MKKSEFSTLVQRRLVTGAVRKVSERAVATGFSALKDVLFVGRVAIDFESLPFVAT